jgi:hypothetical protein
LPEKVINGNSCLELGDGNLGNCSSWIPVSSSAFANVRVHHSNGSLNAFANASALGGICGQGPDCSYRMPLFGDRRMGGTPVVGFPRWNMDASLSKKTPITERVSIGLTLQAVNVFNHMEFTDPGAGGFLDISNTTTFGALTTQFTQPRFLNIGIRVEF